MRSAMKLNRHDEAKKVHLLTDTAFLNVLLMKGQRLRSSIDQDVASCQYYKHRQDNIDNSNVHPETFGSLHVYCNLGRCLIDIEVTINE